MRIENPKVGKFTADAAYAPYLRMKMSGTPGVLTVAGDEAWLGELELRTLKAGDAATIYDKRAPGTHCFVCSAAIDAGDEVSTVAGGKVQTGTGGTVTIGKALSTTTAANQLVEVFVDDSYASFSGARSDLVQQDLQPYPIDLTSLRVWDARQTNLPGTAANDDAGLITGTFGTDAPTIQGVDFGGTATDEKFAFSFALPPEYVAGETITLRARAAMLTTVSDGTATVDFQVHKRDTNGAVGADICATAAQSINSLTPANKDFTITPTGLAAGDVLEIRGEFGGSDTGNVGVMIPEISALAMLLDIKG